MTTEKKFTGKRRDDFKKRVKEVRSYSLCTVGHTYGREPLTYAVDSLIELVASLPFDKISIPVYCTKRNVFGNDRKGNIQVGFIRSFDLETCSFKVVLFSNSAQSVLRIRNAEIFPRVLVEDGKVKSIIGFDIVNADMFSHKVDVVVEEDDDTEVVMDEA